MKVAGRVMDARLTDDQKLLQSTLARFFADRCPLERVRGLEAGDGHDGRLWRGLADLGVLGLLIPEQHGGLGGSFVEVALVCEAIGGALYPSPFLWTCVAAPMLIAQLGDATIAAEWLPRIAAGHALLALLSDDESRGALSWSGMRATPAKGGYRLSGERGFVEYAHQADALLVAAEAPDGLALFLIPRERGGQVIEQRHEISGGQLYRVVCDDVTAHSGERLGGDARAALEQALDHARVALAARMVGAAQRAFDLTARYMRERSQFGQPLLRFQALHFRLAALLTRIDAARLLAYRAAWLIDQGAPFEQAALAAALQASEVYREMAAEAIQLHGGFGFTAEANPQLFYRRAAVDSMLLGSATMLRERVARALDL